MLAEEVKALLDAQLDGCEFIVEGEGSNFQITAIGEVFADLSPVKKQQFVYGALTEKIADGSMHAVTIKTYTPDQIENRDA